MDDVRLEFSDDVKDAEAEGKGEPQLRVEGELDAAESRK